MSGDLAEQVALDLEIFGNGLDHPIAIAQLGQIVLKIADGDALGDRGDRKRCRLCAFEGIQGLCRQATAIAFFRHDIQQKNREPCVRNMSGNARAHGACTEHGCPPDVELTIGTFFLLGSGCVLSHRIGKQRHALFLCYHSINHTSDCPEEY